MEAKNRIAEIDMVKGIAIINVFMLHMCEMTGVSAYGTWFYSIFDNSLECKMFLFVFLSGYVFKSKGSILLDVKNKVKQLLVPYLKFSTFFTLTYFIKYVLFSKMEISLFARNTISNFLADRNIISPLGGGDNIMMYAFVPYWFVATLFTAFMLFFFINKIVEKNVYARMVSAAVLLAVTALLMYLDIGGLLKNTYNSNVSYFTIPVNITGFAGLLMIGTILRHYKIFEIEAHSKRFTSILFVFCLICTVIQIVLYERHYALQYGKWGQYGIWSVLITTFTGFALTYSLIYLSHYIKQINLIKKFFLLLGKRTFDILMLHFGIGELICTIFGFWYPVYHMSEYSPESFAWYHLAVVVILTVVCIDIYIAKKSHSTMNLH